MNTKSKQPDNPWLNLIFNIAIPVIILSKFSDTNRLGPVWGLVASLFFPTCYGIYDLAIKKRYNFISILGFVSILLTGGLGLLKLSGFWFAVKEAGIPAVVALAVLFSLKTKYPLIKAFFYNERMINVDLVDEALQKKGQQKQFEKLILEANYLIALSFGLCACINFTMAMIILKSPTGTPEFNKELGLMTAINYPVILVFCSSILIFALWRMFKGLVSLTGLEFEQIFVGAAAKKK